MEEQKLDERNKLVLGAATCVLVSALLSRLAIGSLLFNLPLLLFAPRIKKTSHAVLTFVASMVLIVGVSLLIDFKDALRVENLGLILFAVYFQIISSVGSMVWVALRDYSDSVLRKLVISSLPIAVLGLLFSIFLSVNGSEAWVEGLKTYLGFLLSSGIPGLDANTFAVVFVTVLSLITVPLGMVFSAIPILVSEFVSKRFDDNWQYEFANMKMPNSYIWFFMGAWAVVVLASLVKIPFWITVIGWNLALGLTLHYFLNGLSVVVSTIRKKQPEPVSVGRICVPIFAICILPIVNIIVISGLALLGALETWFKFR